MLLPNDPRIQPGAYITQDGRLYEVLKADGGLITLENCSTEMLLSTYLTSIITYRLVKPAPAVEDTVPDGLAA